MKSNNKNIMPSVLNLFYKNLELFSPQEQLIEINNVIHILHTRNFSLISYSISK